MAAAKRRSKKRKTAQRKNTGGPHWGSLVTGFSAGLIIALAVWVYGLPELRRNTQATSQSTENSTQSPPVSTNTEKPAVKPLEVTGADFDYYDLLPDQEVVVRSDEGSSQAAAAAQAPITQPGTYFIQAGSFQNPDDADRMRASITILGMRARIQSVDVRDQRFHRVIIGPLDNLAVLNDYRGRLTREGIDTQVKTRAN